MTPQQARTVLHDKRTDAARPYALLNPYAPLTTSALLDRLTDAWSAAVEHTHAHASKENGQ